MATRKVWTLAGTGMSRYHVRIIGSSYTYCGKLVQKGTDREMVSGSALTCRDCLVAVSNLSVRESMPDWICPDCGDRELPRYASIHECKPVYTPGVGGNI